MTRIITITSGLAGVGKTHLAINLAAELVRKGRLTGLYHDDSGHASIDRLLQLSRNSAPKGIPDNGDVLCHGYQGIDVISSRYPLAGWNGLDGRQLDTLLSAHEAWTGYDDFIIDTSGMSPRGVVACCMLSQPVLLVVSPQARSQAEAFALLKVLQLNDFSSPVFPLAVGSKLRPWTNPDSEETWDYYGEFKARCEKLVTDVYGERATVVRPTYVAGPGDRTERFTWWVDRIYRGGEVLAPGNPQSSFSIIDVRDLAGFYVRLLEDDQAGIFNASGPAG